MPTKRAADTFAVTDAGWKDSACPSCFLYTQMESCTRRESAPAQYPLMQTVVQHKPPSQLNGILFLCREQLVLEIKAAKRLITKLVTLRWRV